MIPKPSGVEIPEDKKWEEMSPELRYYYRNKSSWRGNVAQRKHSLKTWLRKKKSKNGCTDCEESHPACLDYHHIKGEKDRTLSKMAHQGVSKEKMEKEIEKCVVLCANCHRKRHWEED